MQAALFAGFGVYRRVNKKKWDFWTYRPRVFFVFNSAFWSFLVTPARIRGAFFAVDLQTCIFVEFPLQLDLSSRHHKAPPQPCALTTKTQSSVIKGGGSFRSGLCAFCFVAPALLFAVAKKGEAYLISPPWRLGGFSGGVRSLSIPSPLVL